MPPSPPKGPGRPRAFRGKYPNRTGYCPQSLAGNRVAIFVIFSTGCVLGAPPGSRLRHDGWHSRIHFVARDYQLCAFAVLPIGDEIVDHGKVVDGAHTLHALADVLR